MAPALRIDTSKKNNDKVIHPLDRSSKRKIRKLGRREKIYDLYYWEEVLQEDGDGGKVVVCRNKSDADEEFEYVLKIKSKKSIQHHASEDDYRKNLLRVLNLPPHLGVTPIIEILENDEYYYCVMEKATGGSLVQHLLDRHQDGVMPEKDLKQMMRDMLEAIGHVHKQGLLHRDIKPENFVVRRISCPNNGDELDQSGSQKKIVERVSLIDFDHADSEYSPDSPCSPSSTDYVCGTQGFNAPEQYLGYSYAASDLWAIGVILYLFMTGSMPYDMKKIEKMARKERRNFSSQPTSESTENVVKGSWCTAVYEKMMLHRPPWDADPWRNNKACSGFCQKLLAFHPRYRFQSAEEALCHPWLDEDGCRLPPLKAQVACYDDLDMHDMISPKPHDVETSVAEGSESPFSKQFSI